ncbi:LuxR C-terminal-related transcriptional regulator [Chloroflexi bacterium TSY]|nr:LuxR C-terminal-related transcriptional regulator [Chloroflexi bacterium TSY]
MALELFVSINTVKTHVKNIFGKLNVRSRTQAVVHARELNLID